MRGLRSIRVQAALFISGLVLVVIVVFAAAAYQQMERSALATSGERLTNVAGQLASVLGESIGQEAAATGELARDSALPRYLASPGGEERDDAADAIRSAAGDGELGGELRDVTGRRVLASRPNLPDRPETLDPELLALVNGRGGAAAGPIRATGDTLFYGTISPVADEGQLVGYVIRWNRIQIAGLVGRGTRLIFANAGGSAWTARGAQLDPSDLTTPADGRVASVERPGIGPVLTVAAPVPGTPWTVIIESTRASIVDGPRQIVVWMVLFGLVLLLAAAATAWFLSGRLTGSIVELAESAKAITSGDYSRRTHVDGLHEIGILGQAFNEMAGSIAETQSQLENKVNELASSEAQHRETRGRMEHVITSSRTILYRVNVSAAGEDRVDWIADNVTRLLGYEVAEALEAGWWSHNIHPDDRAAIDESRERLREVGHETREYRFRDASGEYHWLRDEQRMLRNDQGEATEVIGALSDVTEQRDLTHAKQVAEAANQAKNDFLSRMSHELRTPLNAVLGFGQLLEMDVQTDENRESVEQVLRAGRHLLAMINEVLDIARIDAGKMSLSVEPVLAGSVVQESADLVRLTAARQAIALDIESSPIAEQFVLADQQRLKQVLLNLISNAIKYNRPDGTVTLYYELVDPDRLRIVVRDNGFGIEAAKLDRLFTPFDRLGAEQTAVEGTGLGLALSRGLVLAMGGELGVESVEGEGSRFWIELPLAAHPVATEPPGHEAITFERDVDGRGHTVLFIEDNLANVRLMERVFSRRPRLRLVTAMQGGLGLELAREHHPDLILLDRNLPDLPGEEVMRQLQRDPALRPIPVVMISGDAIPAQVQRMLDLGARTYLTKPFNIADLLQTIDDLLREHEE